MDSALVISRSAGTLCELLSRVSVALVTAASTAEEAKGLLKRESYDLYMIDVRGGESLAKYLAAHTSGEIIMLTQAEDFPDMSEKLSPYGVFTVQKPVDERSLDIALRAAEAAHTRVLRVRRENEKLQRELEDLKIINRAKLLLVSNLKMTEPEAHRYIEKQAMDMRASRREIAASILKTYEN